MNEEEKKAIERIEDTFYSDLGKGINKFQKITLYEDSIRDVRILLNLLEKLQKENELAKKQVEYDKTHIYTPQTIKLNYILIQKVKDEIEKEIKYHEKNILDIENKIMLKNKTAKEEAEIEFNKYTIVVLKKMLQELLEGRK